MLSFQVFHTSLRTQKHIRFFIACESTFQVIPAGTEIGESTRLFKVFFIPSNLLYEMSDFLEASLTDHHIFALPFFDLEFHV
jgi:hypothetical protein